eukprot:gene21735-28757_t
MSDLATATVNPCPDVAIATHTIPGADVILIPTNVLPDTKVIRGHDFDKGRDIDALMESMLTTGFQATSLGQAIHEVNRMWRLSDDPVGPNTDPDHVDPEYRKNCRTRIFLGYTSNLVSSGVRECDAKLAYLHAIATVVLVKHKMVDPLVTQAGGSWSSIRWWTALVTTAGGIKKDLIKCLGHTYMFLVKHKMVDALVTTAGGIEEDLIKCLGHTYMGDFHLKGKVHTYMDTFTLKNKIPVFCPPLTDGSIGDMLFFHSYKKPGLRCDIIEDVRRINDFAMRATPRRTGMILLGGGVPKHHICNANLMRNGADFAVYLNTAQEFDGSDSGARPDEEFDGSDSGARPDEAVSWGKIKVNAQPVKVYGDATILFPLLVSQTFARKWVPREEEKAEEKTE